MNITIHTKLETSEFQSKALSSVANLYGLVKRKLYAESISQKSKPISFKKEFMKQFGITARQFNAVRIDLGGIIDSRRELQKLEVIQLSNRLISIKKKIKWYNEKLKKTEDIGKKNWLKNVVHQKKRRYFNIELQLRQLKADINNDKINICFGGKKLFKKQFNLQENGWTSHAEWKEEWTRKRNSSFFCVGSKDESYGNQSCQLKPDGSLKIRVPHQLVEEFGKHIIVSNVNFKYRQELLQEVKNNKQALAHRLILKDGSWYLHTSFDYTPKKRISLPPKEIGAIGIDFNATNVATAEIDRHGNLVATKTYETNVASKRKDQTLAIYGDCCKDIVNHAVSANKPIVVENLDFTKKKATLRENSNKYARMLSSFAYSTFLSILERRATMFGIKVYTINPAYTSIIGKVKFMGRYGINPHESAAMAIARRINNFSETIPSESAFPSLVKMNGKHVWSKWSFILKNGVRGKHHHFYNWRSLQDTKGNSFNSFDEIFVSNTTKAFGTG